MSGSASHDRPAVHAFGDDALGDLDAVSLARLVAAGERSPAELVDAAIERAQAVNPQLNAVIEWDLDRARERASAPLSGVFAGVPTFWKGLNNVEGLTNRFGSAAVPAKPAEETSPQITQLQAMGVIGLGLSAVPEFGLAATTEPIGNGVCHNPWSLEHSIGGSSGGAASLVASGVVPIAHGNDGAGSLRIPAACGGLVGLKPSRGRVPGDPVPPIFPINPVADGIVSRSVADTAAYLHATDAGRPDSSLPPVGHVVDPAARRLRVGVLLEATDGVAIDSVNAAEVLRVAALLEELGHRVDIVPNPTPAALGDAFLRLWGVFPTVLWHTGSKVVGPGWDRDQLEPVTKWFVKDFRRQLSAIPGAFRRLRRFMAEYSDAYRDVDVYLTSTLGGPVHRLGYMAPDIPGDVQIARARRQVPTTWVQNAGGGPGLSLPLGRDRDGLPLGIHFSADLGQEATLLGLALELEAASPWGTMAGT